MARRRFLRTPGILSSSSFTGWFGIAGASYIKERTPSDLTSHYEEAYHGGGSFKTLAEGTQDLAGLVGLFATEGVERYAADYTRGFLPPMAAPVSLLGLLGYVRALLKLGLGVEFCERIGFSTLPLRPFDGVRRNDSAHGESVITVNYLERAVSPTSIEWRCIKSVPHTPESMPLTSEDGGRRLRNQELQDSSYAIAMCTLDRHKNTAALAAILYAIGLMTSACIASFPVLISASNWTWTRCFACVGLTLSVVLGGLPWCVVYLTEQLPFEPTDWFRSDWKGSTAPGIHSADNPGGSLQRKHSFAFFVRDAQFHVFDCQAVSNSYRWLARIASLCAAITLTVAYICQYIELRIAPARLSGIWLGVQGVLAIVRIVAWNGAPHIPGLGSLDFSETAVQWTDQRDRCFRDSLTELEITLCWASAVQSTPRSSSDRRRGVLLADKQTAAPSMPRWLVEKLDDLILTDALRLSDCLRSGHRQDECFHTFRSALRYWDMPDEVFARWLQLRCRKYGHTVQHTGARRRSGIGSWVCRIIKDIDGRLHIIPGVSLHINLPYEMQQREIIYFTYAGDAEANILGFPNFGNICNTQGLYRGSLDALGSTKSMQDVARQAQESCYRDVAESLWAELQMALTVLGLTGSTTDAKAYSVNVR